MMCSVQNFTYNDRNSKIEIGITFASGVHGSPFKAHFFHNLINFAVTKSKFTVRKPTSAEIIIWWFGFQ